MSSTENQRWEEMSPHMRKDRTIASLSPRPSSRIMAMEKYSDRPAFRLSRSHTMMYPSGSSTDVSSPTYKQRSPTQVGQLSTMYSPKRTHGSFDSNDFHTNSQTLSQLQRSQTTKLGAGIYGKNMWDDDEYVDTGGGSAPKTPTGGAAARRINQQRKAQAQNIKLPDNPFIDGDYADMTGHQRNEGGMEELRSTHQYKSMKTRSQSTSRFPAESETDGMNRHPSDVELTSRDRNLSSSSGSSGSQTWRFKRSDTSPAFRSQGSITEKYADVQRSGSMRGVQPVIEEEGSKRSPSTTLSRGNTEHTMPSDQQGSLGRSATPSGRIQNNAQPAPSPAHSGVSTETGTTFLKPSAPGSPTVVYKSNGLDNNPDSAQVAIVVDEIKPKSPMYGSFANNSQKSDDKSTLKFDATPPRRSSKCLALTVLGVLIIVALLAAVIVLTVMLFQQNDKIARLEREIKSLQAVSTSTEFHGNSTTEDVTMASTPPMRSTSLTQAEKITTTRSTNSPTITTTKSVVTTTADIVEEKTTATETPVTAKVTNDPMTVKATSTQQIQTDQNIASARSATISSQFETTAEEGILTTEGGLHGSGTITAT